MAISRRTILTVLAVLGSAGLFSPQLQARPIVGDIDFGGMVTFDTMSLATATQVTVWNTSYAINDSGDFATFIDPSTHPLATMSAWIFNSGTPGAPLPGPATNSLWSIGGFTFDLTSSLVTFQSSSVLNVAGAGTVSSTHNGLDPTPGLWSFTSTVSNGQNQASFSFQANTTAVPEPSSVILLIGGVCVLTVLGFRRKRAASIMPNQ